MIGQPQGNRDDMPAGTILARKDVAEPNLVRKDTVFVEPARRWTSCSTSG